MVVLVTVVLLYRVSCVPFRTSSNGGLRGVSALNIEVVAAVRVCAVSTPYARTHAEAVLSVGVFSGIRAIRVANDSRARARRGPWAVRSAERT